MNYQDTLRDIVTLLESSVYIVSALLKLKNGFQINDGIKNMLVNVDFGDPINYKNH